MDTEAVKPIAAADRIGLGAKIMRYISSALTTIVVAFGIGFGFGAASSADTRGVSVQLRASDEANAPVSETVKLYSSSHALVIGIDNYTGGWPRLSNAVNDARAVTGELKRQGFNVTLKTNLTATSLDQSLKEFFAIKGSDPDARLLLWYAGHGHTLRGEGYLVPADAPPASSPRFLVTAIPMRGFGSLVRYARSKHVLSVFDSCFSGTVFAARAGALPAAITKKTTKPVRQFLTSGDAGQQVRDDGSFRKLFIRALRGEGRADGNRDGYLTGEELGLFLSQEVATLTDAAQTPKQGKLHDVDFNQGDFVFVMPGADQGVASNIPGAEIVFWQSIKDSTNASMFSEYLRQYPRGQFSGLARLKIEELKAARTAALPPSPTYQVTPWDEEMVAARNANIRAGPTTNAERIGRLRVGAKVDVTGRTKVSGAAWFRVAMTGNRTGYILATLLKKVAVPPPPSPAPSRVQPTVGVFPTKPGGTITDATLLLNCGYPDNNFHTINIRQFAHDVKKMTGGKLRIDVFSAQELFKLRETKQAIQTGQIPMGEIMMPGYGRENPLFLLSAIPFLATTYGDALKLWMATKPYLDAHLDKQGLKLLFVVPWPIQGFYTKKPIRQTADFKGLKFRAYSPVLARMGDELGALPTTVEYSEIPQAFATGLVQSMYTSAQTGIDSRTWDFARHFTNAGGNLSLNGTLISKAAYAKLVPDLRMALDEAAAIAQERGWRMSHDFNIKQIQTLAHKGMVITEPSASFMADLNKVGETLTAEWIRSAGAMGENIIKAYRRSR